MYMDAVGIVDSPKAPKSGALTDKRGSGDTQDGILDGVNATLSHNGYVNYVKPLTSWIESWDRSRGGPVAKEHSVPNAKSELGSQVTEPGAAHALALTFGSTLRLHDPRAPVLVQRPTSCRDEAAVEKHRDWQAGGGSASEAEAHADCRAAIR
ncbi:hypothetical protein FOL47_007251 [Perkinsus chesapeaki]|uniref:Uncharacterized protein n=1 Tax=Perkinsus chesapeaki TaxID=330153 RepID=A0A7J6LLR2_PERCH|nr:hypothetical protein FOL47_007251 [Perkinsus chesapeaki]